MGSFDKNRIRADERYNPILWALNMEVELQFYYKNQNGQKI